MTKRLIVGMSSCRAALLPTPHLAKAGADELAPALWRAGLFGSGGRTFRLPGGDGATTGCHGFSPDSTRFRPDIDRNALKHQLWHPNNAYAQFGTCANTIGSRLAAGPTIGRGHIGGLHGFSVRPLQRGRECDGPDI